MRVLLVTMMMLCRSTGLRRVASSTLFMSTTLPESLSSVHSTNSDDRLARVRDLMKREEIDVFIVPTDDPHMSEYTAPYFGRREFISGFTGSAGTALVLKDKALLFTDGRYHNQAEMELKGSQWTLMKQGLKDVPSITEYLTRSLPEGATVGFDPMLHAAAPLKKMQEALHASPNRLKVKSLSHNIIDPVWGGARPPAPSAPVRLHPAQFAGRSVQDKLADVRKAMQAQNAAALVLTTLDEIAWLFNIRGADVPCNPVTVSYAIVSPDSATLFIDEVKLKEGKGDGGVGQALRDAGVAVRPYEEILAAVGRVEGSIWVDGRTANKAVYDAAASVAFSVVDRESPVIVMKACKNEAELAGMRACHLRDGAAMAEFFAWLEAELESKEGSTVGEVEVDERVCSFRKQLSPGQWLEPSFPTIAGVNSNGAIVHYRAVAGSEKRLGPNDMMLLDSGGQYLDGTTDVTRTLHTGSPSAWQKQMFTRVLKGHIALDSRVFPSGTAGCFLDSYAREHLWAVGKDYIHGTGHGVGAALNVHEGPHRISRVLDAHPLLPGNVVSNEPGYYEDGNFGIRIENLLVVVQRPDLPEFAGRKWLGFERLTHIPIQLKLVDVSLLTAADVAWIDTYHEQIQQRVGPLLQTDRARKWLQRATAKVAVNADARAP